MWLDDYLDTLPLWFLVETWRVTVNTFVASPALAWIGMVGMVGLRRGGPGNLYRSRLEKGLPRF